ncbi:VOC family protein [Bacillus horti]|uniref:Catechol 2,3-dioxygenase-like lactoylglutathione lyase family enzyme n=1 Tax=Caldalkalibacillus horti TaxID=77523 RepID=A0ABT9VX72_9BACI|nr:VOC family protein [Bacillus horti]MDQ0165586.1 catechol 2,3-dioxygenase-like lactoylglutathione lyase family enzyme [Bacillus horti]
MLQKILYNEIPVKDMNKSIEWYKEILGLEFIFYSKEENLAQFNLQSGQMLFLVETTDETNANFTVQGKPHNVIGFQTENIEQLHNDLVRKGVQVEDIENDGGGNKFLNFYDLNGNIFNVQCDVR